LAQAKEVPPTRTQEGSLEGADAQIVAKRPLQLGWFWSGMITTILYGPCDSS